MSTPETHFSPEIELLLTRLSMNLSRHTLSHALLFYGLPAMTMKPIIKRLTEILLCEQAVNAPCGTCKACRLSEIDGHPDYHDITSEKKRSQIKVESIRDLTQLVYTSPQMGLRRVVVIHPAENMNLAASNALLKILEEPPENVYFILQATELSAILPTILSRCQLWRMSDWVSEDHRLDIDPDLEKVMTKMPEMIQDIHQILTEKGQICAIASKWSAMDLYDLATVLYWMTATMISKQLGLANSNQCLGIKIDLPRVSLPVLFKQLDTLNQILKQLKQGISLNTLLTLEGFLLTYTI